MRRRPLRPLAVRDIPEIGCEKRWVARSPSHGNRELDGNFGPVGPERGHLNPSSDHGRLTCLQIPSQSDFMTLAQTRRYEQVRDRTAQGLRLSIAKGLFSRRIEILDQSRSEEHTSELQSPCN